MPEYHVRWEIDLEADSVAGAALEAHESATRPGTTATTYEVCRGDDPFRARWEQVDIDFGAGTITDAVHWEYGHKALFAMAQKMVAEGGGLDAVLEMLERPWKWPELLTAAILDRSFDAVSPGEDILDVSLEEEPERTFSECWHCGAKIVVDDKGPMSTGYWVLVETGSAHCGSSPSGAHEVMSP